MTTQTHGAAMIRQAAPTDLQAIEQLLAANDLPTLGVAEALPGFFVGEHDGRLVGVVGIRACGEYGILRSTAVDSAWRSRGLGRQLVERAIADADTRGMKALYLLTTTAERYFPRFGFAVTARESAPESVQDTFEFRDACPLSATVMYRKNRER
jgi:N-acetylglutamate synthase-like GNAT family acetyltransferase